MAVSIKVSSHPTRGRSGKRSGCRCSLNLVENPRFGCDEGSQVCWAGNILCYFVPNTCLAGAECGLFRSVNPGKESFE